MKQQKVSTRISKCWVEWNTTGLYFFCVGFALCFSSELKCTMKFGVYLPPAAEGSKVPVLYWLSGEWHSVSICVWTCVCKHMGLSMCLWANVSEHVFVSIWVWACVCEQMCLNMCLWANVSEHVFVSKCVWTCVCEQKCQNMCLWANVSEHVFVRKSVRTCVCEQMCLDIFCADYNQLGWWCSSVGRASDWPAADAGSMPWCGKGFFSQSQLWVQTLLQCLYTPMCNRMRLCLCAH